MMQTATTKNEELRFANFQNLVLAQRMLQESPFASRHLLGIGEKEASFISNLTPSEMSRLSQSDVLLFSFRFRENNLDKLSNFLKGDDLSLTHLHLTTFANGGEERA